MNLPLRPALLAFLFLSTRLFAETPAAPWSGAGLPFSFKYAGADSGKFLSSWQRQDEALPEGKRITFSDPATGLVVRAEVRLFPDEKAVEWVLRFANHGQRDTPIIEEVQPLRWSIPTQPKEEGVLRYARGSDAKMNDFEPQETHLRGGAQFRMVSTGGRSSEAMLPFFDLRVGEHGWIGAIGWSGNWFAEFRNRAGLEMAAGLPETHFILHPGEEIRTPRILLQQTEGDFTASHNRWRQLLLNHYSPRDADGRPLTGPACYGTWGNEPIARKLEVIRRFQEQRILFDVYWVDAGWYGPIEFQEGSTVFNTPWNKHRGDWYPSKVYPEGLAPLGAALHKAGLGFLLWLEPEEADPGTDWLMRHPEWFFPGPAGRARLLNLGDATARKGVTDFISQLVTDSGLTWYRQDFNTSPEAVWHAADAPDRIGVTEMKYIEGLYAFWDELRQRHPGLQIDNCASGGRRLDLETISRSVSLWRTDLSCFTADPAPIARETQALAPWLPISAGCCEGNTVYALRSAYGPAMVVDSGMNIINQKQPEWLRDGLVEFRLVRPFFSGDFYPLLSDTAGPDTWTAWQFHRPDQRAGVAAFFRREASPFATVAVHLQAIDPEARYTVEIRPDFVPVKPRMLTGRELNALTLTISEQPGSTLILYHEEK